MTRSQNEIVGDNIRLFRQKMGLTQEELANYLDVKRTMISYFETGARPIPIEALLSLSDLFGCEFSDLLEENPDSFNACLAFAFRSDELKNDDLLTIAEFKKVVKNYLTLINLKNDNES